jgi:hypothetical protein
MPPAGCCEQVLPAAVLFVIWLLLISAGQLSAQGAPAQQVLSQLVEKAKEPLL